MCAPVGASAATGRPLDRPPLQKFPQRYDPTLRFPAPSACPSASARTARSQCAARVCDPPHMHPDPHMANFAPALAEVGHNIGQVRSEFGGAWLGVEQIDRNRSIFGSNRPHLVEIGKTWSKSKQIQPTLVEVGRSWPKPTCSAEVSPNLAELVTKLATFGRTWLDRSRPESGSIWKNVLEIGPFFSPRIYQHWRPPKNRHRDARGRGKRKALPSPPPPRARRGCTAPRRRRRLAARRPPCPSLPPLEPAARRESARRPWWRASGAKISNRP